MIYMSNDTEVSDVFYRELGQINRLINLIKQKMFLKEIKHFFSTNTRQIEYSSTTLKLRGLVQSKSLL